MNLELVNWLVCTFNVLVAVINVVVFGSIIRHRKQLLSKSKMLLTRLSDLEEIERELQSAARYAIAVGGQPVRDELNRLVVAANETARRAIERDGAPP